MLGEPGAEGARAGALGGIVAGKEGVLAPLLGEVVSLQGGFAAEVDIEAFAGGVINALGGAAGADADGVDDFAAVVKTREPRGLERVLHGLGEGVAGERRGEEACDTNHLPVIVHEGTGAGEAQESGDLGVVAETRVGIEREVDGVEREVATEGVGKDATIEAVNAGEAVAPGDAVVDDKHLGAEGVGGGESFEAGVNGDSEAGDGALVLDLETVMGGVAVELGTELVVQKGGNVFAIHGAFGPQTRSSTLGTVKSSHLAVESSEPGTMERAAMVLKVATRRAGSTPTKRLSRGLPSRSARMVWAKSL